MNAKATRNGQTVMRFDFACTVAAPASGDQPS
jgi:hypothetical protein